MHSCEDDRRLVSVQVPHEVGLRPLFRRGSNVEQGVPLDARFVTQYEQPELHAYDVVFRSDSFDVVSEAGMIPEVPLSFSPLRWENSDPGRKQLRRLKLSNEMFSYLFTEEITIEEGVPADAEIKTWYENAPRLSVEFIFRSEEFEPVPKGKRIPDINDQFEFALDGADETDGTLSSYVTQEGRHD